jgi:thiamine biosynthesis protein ThiS
VTSEYKIRIILNGLNTEIPEGASIASLIRTFNEGDAHLIVEHNGRFVYPQKYAETRVAQGDVLELINPDFGG